MKVSVQLYMKQGQRLGASRLALPLMEGFFSFWGHFGPKN